MLGAMHNKWVSRYKRATLRAEHLRVAGSRGMVTSLMDTAHKTDTECHEAAITAFTLTNYIAGRMTQWHSDSS